MDNIAELKIKIGEAGILSEKITLQIELAHATRFTDPSLSISTGKAAWEAARENSESILELSALIAVCASYAAQENVAQLSQWAQILKERAQQLKSYSASGRAELFFYFCSKQNNNIPEAEDYLKNALKNFEAADNIQGQTTCYISLGNIKFNNAEHDAAYELYQTALKICPDDNAEILTILKQNIASIYVIKEKYLKAWEVYQDLLDIIPANETATRALILLNLGSINICTGELDSAIDYFDEVIELTRNLKNNSLMVKAQFKIVEAFLLQENLDSAKGFAKMLESTHNDGSYNKLLIKMYQNFINYYKDLENEAEIKKYQQKIDSLQEL